MTLDDRLNVRIPKELKAKFLQLAQAEGYEKPSTAIRDVIRQIVNRGTIRQEAQHEVDTTS